jgi:hypothetical protein
MPASTNKPPVAGTSAEPPRRLSFFQTDSFPPVASYINRASFLLSQGRPAAKAGLYFPTLSLWYGDNESNASLLALSQQLMENKYDFDFVDEQALTSVLTLENGTLINSSGQAYRAIIVPRISVISAKSLLQLKRFADAGGKVIFMEKQPELVIEKNFLEARKAENMDWAFTEISGKVTPAVLSYLPPSDLTLEPSCPDIKYLHRRLKDAELYFLFNEGTEKRSFLITLSGKGSPQVWDAMTGEITRLKNFVKVEDDLSFPLVLESQATKFIIISN